ncbi:mycothiol system anti-sigma-R factor [Nocardioides sp.]|uniref:mycothiol system anti-sigma-R factor n=1 Tax=Nocardioides sp. TaxID=35761 RepID=UPI00260D602E|nr:mycothiol system anti-sigma-R factor [Nocardioides sp.]
MNEHVHPSSADCVDFLERIVYFIDNELDQADCAAVREHLDTCNPCLERYDLQRTVKQVVARSCHETAPGELRAKVLLRLEEVRIEIQ